MSSFDSCALKCSTWNIRRGLLTREAELRNLLILENIDVIFLTETDTRNLSNEDSYVIQGYKTILPLFKPEDNLVRIVCLIKESLMPHIKIRHDLMSEEFPSIWIEYQTDQNKKPTLIAGFYRVWTHNGVKTTECQLTKIKLFNNQIEKAFEQKNRMNMLILGDANLCAKKRFLPKFVNKNVAKALQFTLSRCGMKIANVGPTFLSDHIKIDGEPFGSALDHIYYSSAFENKIVTTTIKNSSSDHLPVVCEVRSLPKVMPYSRQIMKRCLKKFTDERWNECLSSQDWSGLENCEAVDEMVDIYTINTEKALDEIAPYNA